MTNRPPINRNRPAYQIWFINSLHTGMRLITNLALLTSIYNQPTNWPLTLSSLLTGLSLTTRLLLPALTSHRPANWPLTISSPPTGLRLITLVLLPALHPYRSGNHQRQIWIPVLIRILTLLLKNCPLVSMRRVKCRIWKRIPLYQTQIRLLQRSKITETMHGVHSYMGWTHSSDIDTHTSSAEDNPFAAPKQQPVGRVNVNLPTDDWLCRKMEGLNLTLTQGYLSRSSETGGWQKDQFVKHSKSYAIWYGLYPNQDRLAGSVSFWYCDSAKLNNAYSWIARSSGLTSPAPTSVPCLMIFSGIGRRKQGSTSTFVIKQPDLVGTLVRSSKVCRCSSEFYSLNKPKGSRLAK